MYKSPFVPLTLFSLSLQTSIVTAKSIAAIRSSLTHYSQGYQGDRQIIVITMKFLSAAAACTLSATFMVAVNGAPLALKDKRMVSKVIGISITARYNNTFQVVSFAAYPDVEGPIKREADAEADPMVALPPLLLSPVRLC